MNLHNEKYDERNILDRIACGDEEAFSQLFHAWRDKLYYFLIKIGATPQSAEDLLQDIFLKLWLGRSNLVNVSNFNAYLYRASRNHIFDLVSRISSEREMLSELGKNETPSDQASDAILVNKQLQELILSTVESLPPQQRKVYKLGRIEGYKQEEIAAEMQISVSTVKNHMTQAIKAIKDQVRQKHFFFLMSLAAAVFRD